GGEDRGESFADERVLHNNERCGRTASVTTRRPESGSL
ncbi:MAG: hypothetical protein AVDCRST_MAG22-3836, partial [uncultured Rubrobacteraceae bacterium]